MTEPAAEPTSWLSVQEVARRIQVSNMTIHRLIDGGQLIAADVGTGGTKRQLRISEDSLAAFLASARVATKEAS